MSDEPISNRPTRTGSVVFAFLFAPFAAALTGALATILLLSLGARSLQELAVLGWFAFFVLAVFSYWLTLLAMLPAYLILTRLGVSSVWLYVGLGWVIAIGFFVLNTAHNIDIFSQLLHVIAYEHEFALPISVSGLMGGFVFWRLAKPYELPPSRHRLPLYDQ